MPALLTGVLSALGASALFALGMGLQTLEARQETAESALRLSLFWRLIRRPRWVAGTALGIAGWLCQAFALTKAPLTLVQPLLGMTLVFLLFVAVRQLDEHVGRREIFAAVAVAGGVPLLAVTTPARHAAHSEGARLWVTLAILAVLALLPLGLRGAQREPPGAGRRGPRVRARQPRDEVRGGRLHAQSLDRVGRLARAHGRRRPARDARRDVGSAEPTGDSCRAAHPGADDVRPCRSRAAPRPRMVAGLTPADCGPRHRDPRDGRRRACACDRRAGRASLRAGVEQLGERHRAQAAPLERGDERDGRPFAVDDEDRSALDPAAAGEREPAGGSCRHVVAEREARRGEVVEAAPEVEGAAEPEQARASVEEASVSAHCEIRDQLIAVRCDRPPRT